jgi:hypothetical protein
VPRRRIVLPAAAIVLLAAAAVLTVAVWPREQIRVRPAAASEREMRAAVTKYVALWEPARPAKFYGKQLTPVRCVSLMKGRDAQLGEVANGDAYESARSSWSTLSGLIRQEQDLARQFGVGTVPTSCTGKIGYWEVRSGGGDRYVVRAAVFATLTYGRWDEASHALTGTGSISYDEASADEYTL